MDVGLFMLYEFEFDVFPEGNDVVELFFHFELLFALVADVLDAVFEFVEFEVPDVVEDEVFVDFEVSFDEFADFVPMAVVFGLHGGVFEFRHEREEGVPFFHLLLDALEDGGLTVDAADVQQLFTQTLDLVFHFHGIDFLPF